MRRDQPAAVGHGRHHAHHLQRRGRERTLADGHRLRVGGSPRVAFQIADVLRARERAGGLAGQVHARRPAETEPLGPIDQRPRPHQAGEMEEVDVAAHGQRVGQRHLAVADALADVDFASLPVGLVQIALAGERRLRARRSPTPTGPRP